METKETTPIRGLICAVCGASTRGRQWWNRDNGYGVCARCYARSELREGRAESIRLYGEPGVHHSLAPTPTLAPERSLDTYESAFDAEGR